MLERKMGTKQSGDVRGGSVAAPWRTNEDDLEIDGEKLKGEVAMMDQDHKG